MSNKWNIISDVIVVGSGFSGLTAAIEAHDSGSEVIILEKMDIVGGNSIIAGGSYNAVDPARQVPLGIKDSINLHFQQTLEGGDYRGETNKIRFFVENSLKALHWLEKMGVVFSPIVVEIIGSLWPRTHRVDGPKKGGAGIIAVLVNEIKRRSVPINLKHRVIKIIRERPFVGKIMGVEVLSQGQKLKIKANKGVILASGGFGADVNMRMKYNSRFDKKFSTTNHVNATGECLNMAYNIGGSLRDLNYIQCIGPTGRDIRVGKAVAKRRAPINYILGLSTNRVIYTNLRGERIVSSDARRDKITEAAMMTKEKVIVTIGDDDCRKSRGIFSRADAEKFSEKYPKEIFKGETIRELAIKIGMKPDILEGVISNYNKYVENGNDVDCGQASRNLVYKIEQSPFWAGTGSPSIHFTLGGLEFEGTTTKVLDRWGSVIPRLYASGEVTTGIHGSNRLGGNAIPECIVYGRVAGRVAATGKFSNPWNENLKKYYA